MANNRIKSKELGVGNITDFHNHEWTKKYYHVLVGNYSVSIPETLNVDTLEGIQLIRGKASIIESLPLATRIAKETSGTILHMEENYSRVGREIKI